MQDMQSISVQPNVHFGSIDFVREYSRRAKYTNDKTSNLKPNYERILLPRIFTRIMFFLYAKLNVVNDFNMLSLN